MAEQIIVTDLCRDSTYLALFNKVVEEIQLGDDELKSNYVGIQPKDFASLTVALRGSEVLAFSGMQIQPDRWGHGKARVSARFYLQKFEPSDRYVNSAYLIPRQIAVARSLNLDCVFISREDKRRSFGKFIDLVNANGGYNFKMHETKLGVCGPLPPGYMPAECCQWVATMPLKSGSDLDFIGYLKQLTCEQCNEAE
jgi:hypothetical protein